MYCIKFSICILENEAHDGRHICKTDYDIYVVGFQFSFGYLLMKPLIELYNLFKITSCPFKMELQYLSL